MQIATLPLSTKAVCVCPKPSMVEDFEAWKHWVRTHWRECTPRLIEDLELPPWEGVDD